MSELRWRTDQNVPVVVWKTRRSEEAATDESVADGGRAGLLIDRDLITPLIFVTTCESLFGSAKACTNSSQSSAGSRVYTLGT